MENKLKRKDFWAFFKKYGYIVVLSIIVMAVAITLALTVNNDNTEPTDSTPITLYNPILNATVAKSYSSNSLLYNSTLKHWEAHKAITFTVGTNTDVFAVLDGTVKEIRKNYLDGTVIVIEHQEGLKSVYSSLAEDIKVKVNDVVKKGDVIGNASNTANKELNLGNHLRFELYENGVNIDPSSYLNLGNK